MDISESGCRDQIVRPCAHEQQVGPQHVLLTATGFVARMKGGAPERQQFDLWFERVYANRDGRWQ